MSNPLPDYLGYDLLVDEFAFTPRWERDFARPSDYPTASAFVAAASDVAALLPATVHEQGEGVPSAPSPARGNSEEQRHE